MKLELIERQTTIPADRVVLRPLDMSDAPNVERYSGDLRVSQMTTSIPFPMPKGAAVDFIRDRMSADRPEDVWVIDGSPSGIAPVVGLVSLKFLDRDQSEIGYWVAPPFWNRGYAREAVAALMAANPHGNRSVVACVFQDNPASARVLEATGFAALGEAEAFSIARAAHVPTWTYLKRLS
jgi:RimJ/RimL family protein N-acetyltransferase